MTIGDRIKRRIKELGITRADVMRHTGATKGSISQWCNDRSVPRGEYLVPLCEVLKCNLSYLLYGEVQERESRNFSDTNYARGMVPVISKVQAGNWREQYDDFEPGHAEDYLPCPKRHGKHTYALKIDGDSMTAPHGKSYPNGCYVYFDPDRRGDVRSGDCVVARLNGEEETTFKQFIKDGSRTFLRPLNPTYPALHEEFTILAKSIGKWEDDD